MKKQIRGVVTSSFLPLLLCACTLTPVYERPVLDAPSSWSQTDEKIAETLIPQDWWKGFQSPELDALISSALENNLDVRAAVARIEQARGVRQSAQAGFFPSLDATGAAGHSYSDSAQADSTFESIGQAAFTVSYELDLFGRVRATHDVAEAQYLGSQLSHDALRLVVMAEVAKTYFSLVNLRERLSIADQNLESSRDLLKIVQARYDAGATTLLDVAQQKSDLASDAAARSLIARNLAVTQSALAVLLGVSPQQFSVQAMDLRSLVVPFIAPGQPSSLLERRPDIRSAEADLVAANADIGVAKAAFFPIVNLGVDASILASPIGDPATKAADILASIAAPLFKGGRLRGQLASTEARRDELVHLYRKAVLTAFKEVEDALAAERSSREREEALQTAMDESRKAYQLSKEQYEAGTIDFQTLLNARRAKLAAEDNYIQTKNERLAAAVDLYRTLGGGWLSSTDPRETSPEPTKQPKAETVQ